ncbi:MAG TPA: hypothetical protein VIL65_02605 [Beijerinckiaceae bacterium]|jgi:hypothetical protein
MIAPFQNRYFVLSAYLLIAAASLWLRTGFPVHAIGPAGHDDYLFVRSAILLGAGQWLGPYDNLTLAKGMFYPLFILASKVAGLPLKLAEHVIYLAAALGFARLAGRLARSETLALLLFLVLACNPVLWTAYLARVIREGVYIGLCLGLVVLATALLDPHRRWAAGSPGRAVALAGVTGVVGGAYWLTREEGIWILPTLACVAFISLVSVYLPLGLRGSNLVRQVFAKSSVVVAALAVGVALVAIVAQVNRRAYGVATDVEFKAAGYVAAYGALSRVRHPHWQRYVVVPKAVREAIYAVSPAAAELRQSLDGPNGAGWREVGCRQQGIDPCPDILGGWFMWALRDAAAAAGHHRSGGEAEAYYVKLASEINAACAAGRLDCLPPRNTLQPPFRDHYVKDALALTPRMLKLLLRFEEGRVGSAPSIGSADRLRLVSAMVGPIEPPEVIPGRRSFSGWIASTPNVPAWLAIEDGGRMSSHTITFAPAADVDAAMVARGLVGRRFTVDPPCQESACSLIIDAAGSRQSLAVAGLEPGAAINRPDLVLYIDAVGPQGDSALADVLHQRRQQAVQRVAQAITKIYVAASPILFFTGLAGLCLALVAFRRDGGRFFLAGVGLAAAGAVVTRIALLSYLDVTTIPSLNLLYLSPAEPFALIVAMLGSWLGATAFWTSRQSRRGGTGRPAA